MVTKNTRPTVHDIRAKKARGQKLSMLYVTTLEEAAAADAAGIVDPAIGAAGDVDTAVVTGAKPTYFFLERYLPAYAAGWAAFVSTVNSGGQLPVTLDDGVAARTMAEAASQSVKTGGAVTLASVLL